MQLFKDNMGKKLQQTEIIGLIKFRGGFGLFTLKNLNFCANSEQRRLSSTVQCTVHWIMDIEQRNK